MRRLPLERFDAKVNAQPDDGCWLWTGGTNPAGYGEFWNGAKKVYAHRWSYEHHVGPIPTDRELDHLCKVRHCVNPDHLKPVTHAENMARGANALKTHCPRGHAYRGWNLYLTPAGSRRCRECHRAECRERYLAMTAATDAA